MVVILFMRCSSNMIKYVILLIASVYYSTFSSVTLNGNRYIILLQEL